MQIIVQNPKANVLNTLRQCGYSFERHHAQSAEASATRDLAVGGFPRFHCYAKYDENKSIVINLHLDQKRPSYSGARAHGGEYEGEVVQREADRIRSALGISL